MFAPSLIDKNSFDTAMKNKTEKPFSLQDDEKTDKTDND